MRFFRRSKETPVADNPSNTSPNVDNISMTKSIGTILASHGLDDWWKAEFSEDERIYINEKSSDGNYDVVTNSSGLLKGLASSFSTAADRHIAKRIFVKAEEAALSDPEFTVLDLHFLYSEMVEVFYRERENTPTGLDEAIAICEKQINISSEAAKAFLTPLPIGLSYRDLGLDVDMPEDENINPTVETLPYHRGYTQLCIIREKQKNYEEAIRIATQAMNQGWTMSDWEKRIERCQKRLAK